MEDVRCRVAAKVLRVCRNCIPVCSRVGLDPVENACWGEMSARVLPFPAGRRSGSVCVLVLRAEHIIARRQLLG